MPRVAGAPAPARPERRAGSRRGPSVRSARHRERHRTGRVAWLRAAVLGANDGIVSTASLILGVAAANTAPREVIVAGVAALVAGAMSMAAGEYVSVHSQVDSEAAELSRERRELAQDPVAEQRELVGIYVARGLAPALADQVAKQLMAHDALGAHARDELGLSEARAPHPLLAAGASAASFALGAALPLAIIAAGAGAGVAVFAASLASLMLLGAVAAQLGGAPIARGAVRIGFWGALAMLATIGIGRATILLP